MTTDSLIQTLEALRPARTARSIKTETEQFFDAVIAIVREHEAKDASAQQTFTATGTWTKTGGEQTIKVDAWQGGPGSKGDDDKHELPMGESGQPGSGRGTPGLSQSQSASVSNPTPTNHQSDAPDVDDCHKEWLKWSKQTMKGKGYCAEEIWQAAWELRAPSSSRSVAFVIVVRV